MINHIHGIGSKAFALLLSMDRLELRDKEKAIEEYWDADFGVLECIDAQAINAEDENGNLYDYQ